MRAEDMIERPETWGALLYSTSDHAFSLRTDRPIQEPPYTCTPIVLNVSLTFRCNMACVHCVARDLADELGGQENADLNVTPQLSRAINDSPFMVVVLTGGEPLLPVARDSLMTLLDGLRHKALILDTNATLLPPPDLTDKLARKRVMVRVSWDSPDPNAECQLRRFPDQASRDKDRDVHMKEEFITRMRRAGVRVAVQTVIHAQNFDDPYLCRMFARKLADLGVSSWYLQRFIPARHMPNSQQYTVTIERYERVARNLGRHARKHGIGFSAKKDRRHNSVFLLVRHGELFTQSDTRLGAKLALGALGEVRNYFEYVSAADHSDRYLADATHQLASPERRDRARHHTHPVPVAHQPLGPAPSRALRERR